MRYTGYLIIHIFYAFVPNFFAQRLINRYSHLFDISFNINWCSQKRAFHKNVFLFRDCVKKPIALRVFGCFELSLKTFVEVNALWGFMSKFIVWCFPNIFLKTIWKWKSFLSILKLNLKQLLVVWDKGFEKNCPQLKLRIVKSGQNFSFKIENHLDSKMQTRENNPKLKFSNLNFTMKIPKKKKIRSKPIYCRFVM